MDLAGSVKRAIEIVKLNGAAAAEVARDEQSLGPGLVLVAGGGLAGGISGLVSGGGIGGLIGGPIAAVVGCVIGVAILHFVATTFFGGSGDYLALLRAEAHAGIIGWAGIVPIVGALVGLWHLPVSVVILQNVYGMTRDKAIATVAVIFGVLLLFGVVMALLFGAFLGGLFLGAGAGR